MFASARAKNVFLVILNDIRKKYDFLLVGQVVMPEHIHLLMGEPTVGDPSKVMQVVKQRVSRKLRGKKRRKSAPGQMRLWKEELGEGLPRFWQRRFYDFNVWSRKKRNEKLNYMHFNPVKRGLVEHPKDWEWSSYRFYWKGEKGLCPPNPGWEPRKKIGA
jgi:putative transposase